MSDPPPLRDVLEIVERRRRRRGRVQAAAGSALAVAGAGVAGLIVVVLQSGPADLVPAAAPEPTLPTSAALSAAPPPPFDRTYLRPDYLEQLATSLFTAKTEAESQDSVDEAATMAAAWDMDLYPATKAVLAKAEQTGTPIDAADPNGDDELVSRFAEAGYTDADAAELARAWGTDTRTAKVVGGLIVGG